MVAAVRQIVKVQAEGRLEIISPELRLGAITEVIVLMPEEREPVAKSAADRVAALANLQRSFGLTTDAADDWIRQVRLERDAWDPSAKAGE